MITASNIILSSTTIWQQVLEKKKKKMAQWGLRLSISYSLVRDEIVVKTYSECGLLHGHTWHDTTNMLSLTQSTSCLWRSSLSAVRNAPLRTRRIKIKLCTFSERESSAEDRRLLTEQNDRVLCCALTLNVRNGCFYEAVLWTRGCTLISGCTGTPVGQHKCNCRLPLLTRTFAYLHGLHLSQEQQSSCLLAVYSESNLKKRIQSLNPNIPDLRLQIRYMMCWW